MIIDPQDDESARAGDRAAVASGSSVLSREHKQLKMKRIIGEDGQTEEEYDFNTEVNLGQQNPIWKEKYRPRKPRFFNRVHTVRADLNVARSGVIIIMHHVIICRDLSGTSITRLITTQITLHPR